MVIKKNTHKTIDCDIKNISYILSLIFLFSGFTTQVGAETSKKHVEAITEVIATTHFSGSIDAKIHLVIDEQIKSKDIDALIEPFFYKNETRLWQSEFIGKWMLGACSAYNYTKDPQLYEKIKYAAHKLISAQLSNGYIGNYADTAHLTNWDVWGRKYCLLGLLNYYSLSNDKKTLVACSKLADHLIQELNISRTNIFLTSRFRGMPSSSILEPIIQLYKFTNNANYLQFAKQIVAQWELPQGPKLISKALSDVNVYERFPHPSAWWSWDNGQKAYEMMSCYDGLLELYQIEPQPEYLKSVEMTVSNIIDNEINIAGSGSSFECWFQGKEKQTHPAFHTMETCVTTTWMKLCYKLLRLTNDVKYADQIETTLYNALFASLRNDGKVIAKYSALSGIKHEGEDQCGLKINCCIANGPRGFMLLPEYAVTSDKNSVYVNLYTNGQTTIGLRGKPAIKLTQQTDYPIDDTSEFTLSVSTPTQLALCFRIPGWSKNTEIKVNGEVVKGVLSGEYFKLNRSWTENDKISIKFDMLPRLIQENRYQAIVRGPIVFARDSRFADGVVDECAVISNKNGILNAKAQKSKQTNMWITLTVDAVLGSDMEREYKIPRKIHFCDMSSAGNTWDESSRFRVWIPQTINPMETEYYGY